jgi:hypothetical protein
MTRSTGKNGRTPANPPDAPDTNAPDDAYRVGPGRPPRKFQYKPGQSGNPLGARRKASSLVPDLGAVLERALSEKVTLRQGDREQIVTKATAGIEQLVNQFAKGAAMPGATSLIWRKGSGLISRGAAVRPPRARRLA